MEPKTLHIYRADNRLWNVQKVGSKPLSFTTQAEAVKEARRIAGTLKEVQVVLHKRSGRFVVLEVRGMPVIQKSREKSSIGALRISQAIWAQLKPRLEASR